VRLVSFWHHRFLLIIPYDVFISQGNAITKINPIQAVITTIIYHSIAIKEKETLNILLFNVS